ncbi:MAG: periplasmic heavy metal sensor [Acidobacteria bacterium]|nr:periplasmic heavy metal sensor [Acidobacteriota bacterium]
MKRVLLALLAIGMVLPAMAQERPDIPCAVPCEHHAVVQFLQLSEDQAAQWDTLMADRQATVEPLREQLRAVEQQLMDLLGQPDPDPAAVGALTIQGHDLREQIRAANEVYRQGFEALLDETQAGKLRFIRGAARVRALIPAFRRFGLLRPAQNQEEPAPAGQIPVEGAPVS